MNDKRTTLVLKDDELGYARCDKVDDAMIILLQFAIYSGIIYLSIFLSRTGDRDRERERGTTTHYQQ